MLGKAVLCLVAAILEHSTAVQGECTDLHGRTVTNGLHYIPGPDTCTLCICDNGLPRVCKAVLCSPPQDCRSFRVGSTCCEFICLDDVVKPSETHEANFRLVGGGVGGIVLITIALSVYRVRKQKRRRPPHIDDRGSLTSIGYISGSMGCMGGACEPVAGAWKPPGHYLPRGEAPPPYEEAMAQCRSDQIRFGDPIMRSAYSNNLEPIARSEDSMQCVGHGYVNLTRPVSQLPNTQSCFTAPLLQPVHAPEARDSNIISHHPLAPPIGRGLFRLTGSLGTISNRALSLAREDHDRERPHNVPGFYTTHTALHRTIPRISTASETSAVECFTRGERACGDVRRSFHRPEPPRDRHERIDRIDRQTHAHPRSVPRNLNIASTTDTEINLDDTVSVKSGGRSRAHSEEQVVSERGKARPAPPPPLHAQPVQPPPPSYATSISHVALSSHAPPTAHAPPTSQAQPNTHAPSNIHAPSTIHAPPPIHAPPTVHALPTVHAPPNIIAPPNSHASPISHGPIQPTEATPITSALAPQSTLPLTVDKPSCGCSYSGRAGRGAGEEEADDYRSECENCKATADTGWEEPPEGWGCGTQTLQRRAPPPAPPPPHTATLPQPVTRHERPMGQPSNWENWFNTIPDSDTESDED